MHNTDRVTLEAEQELGHEAEHSENEQFLGSILGAITGGGAEIALHESQELELASRLLEVGSEMEFEQFLGDLFRTVGRNVGQFVRSDTGRALGGILKDAARQALPVVGQAIGDYVSPGAGATGASLAQQAGSLLGLELEGLSPPDQEFEAARQFVRLAGAASRQAAAAPRNVAPQTAARAAVVAAAHHHAPGLAHVAHPRPGAAAAPRAAHHPAAGPSAPRPAHHTAGPHAPAHARPGQPHRPAAAHAAGRPVGPRPRPSHPGPYRGAHPGAPASHAPHRPGTAVMHAPPRATGGFVSPPRPTGGYVSPPRPRPGAFVSPPRSSPVATRAPGSGTVQRHPGAHHRRHPWYWGYQWPGWQGGSWPAGYRQAGPNGHGAAPSGWYAPSAPVGYAPSAPAPGVPPMGAGPRRARHEWGHWQRRGSVIVIYGA